MRSIKRITTTLITSVLLVAGVSAQNLRDVEIRTEKVSKNVYVLYGQGGNIGLSVGDNGAFLIDDQFAPLTEKITKAVARLTDKPVTFVINTHWHGDHTGGNENLGKAGAIIVAHENVRETMSREQFLEAFNNRVPAAPDIALPVITFADSIDFHWNGDDIHVFHVAPAHTNGDSIIHFRKANVIHMGDTYFNGMYPFIDTSTGGVIDGMISAADRGLEIADENTKIIPGHGQVSGVTELRAYRDMLKAVRDRIDTLISEGRSRDEIIAAHPTRDLDETWGKGFMQPDQWVGIVYDGMVKSKERRIEEGHGGEKAETADAHG